MTLRKFLTESTNGKRLESKPELRKSKRFAPEENAFFAFRPEFKKLGRIKDISRRGLGCEYLAHEEVSEQPPKREIDILLSSGSFYMSMVPCKIVYDVQVAKDEYSSNHIPKTRRCGLEFWELNEEQGRELDFFLKNHVVGTV